MNNYITTALLGATIFLSQNSEAQNQKPQQNPGISVSSMDKTVRPNDDFFRFVNGSWLDKTDIPADRTRWGSFDELRKNTDEDMLKIVAVAAKNPEYKSSTDQGKALNYYRTILDTVARNNAGIAPLKGMYSKINAVQNVKDLQKLMTETDAIGGVGFINVYVGSDSKDSNKNVVNIGLGGVGLPDRDYYVSEDADSKEKREKYKTHVAKMFQMTGMNPANATADAQRVIDFETKLSEPRLDRVERRDDRKTYNPMTVAELQKLVPSIKWSEYLTAIGLPNTTDVIVSQPRYMTALQNLLLQNNVQSWQAYMKWLVLNRYSGTLTTDLETANWDFYGKTLTGAVQQRPRNERALATVNGGVGEALGKLYVAQKFPPEAKAKAEKMIANVIKAFGARIDNLTWMSPETKKSAHAKLQKSQIKIGYPDKWKDYSKLVLVDNNEGGTFFDNAQKLAKWRTAVNYAKINKPVDKTEWGMSPQTVNAYYNPSYNEIVFPAAILQPPFYDYKADDAVNYGGIGAVIGHEISHGFDDSGARYDADGNLVDWWSETDQTQFAALTGALADQYSLLEPVKGTFVDGKFTLGENIGDLGGVNAAYDGLQLYMKENGRPANIDGFTPEQRFFISWATVWRTKMRDEAIKNQVKTDPHSPGMYRGYVPLQNVASFYDAFNIKPGDKMYVAPEKRVIIW